MQQQTVETTREPITRTHQPKVLYKAGLMARMREYAKGTVHYFDAPSFDVNGYETFAEGYADADDDSDEPRGDDAAHLAAYARAIFGEITRIGAVVSAWPDFKTGYVRLDDGLTDEAHDGADLLATLRGLPAGAGTCAMWAATTPIAVACLSWQSCCVVTDCARAETE
jgi:hypothetical protein